MELGIAGLAEVSEIGRGGFGVVYRAWQPGFGRWVAVKVLAAHLDDSNQRRFERERFALGSLSEHPNIVTVYEAGVTDSGLPYLLMELMPGGSFADRIGRDGPLSWQEAVAVGGKIANALGFAHEHDVLHCDLKPGNVLISSFNEPVLADFGIARIVAEATGTTSGVITASIAHAAPEVLAGEPPTPVSDVWSLASTIVTMMTGRPPFARAGDTTYHAMIARITGGEPVDLSGLDAPQGVRDALAAALEKDPTRRTSSARALGEALTVAGADGVVDDSTMTVPGVPPANRAGGGAPPKPPVGPLIAEPSPSRKPIAAAERRRVGVAVFGGVGAVVLLIVGFLIFGRKSSHEPTPPSTTAGSSALDSSDIPIDAVPMGANSVVAIDDETGTHLDDASGEIRGANVLIRVTAVGTASSVTANQQHLKAATNQKLIVWRMDAQDFDSHTGSGQMTPADAALIVDGSAQHIDLGSLGQGLSGDHAEYLEAASIPMNPKQLDLTLTRFGFKQTYSLLDRKATGDRPDALYRDSAKPFVEESSNLQQILTVTPTSGDAPGQLILAITDVELSFFKPNFTGTADSHKAYLWIAGDATIKNICGGDANTFPRLPPTTVVLTLPDGSTVNAEYFGDSPGFSTAGGVFNGAWGFEVPSTFSGGTITVTPGRLVSTGTTCPPSLDTDGSATFNVSL